MNIITMRENDLEERMTRLLKVSGSEALENFTFSLQIQNRPVVMKRRLSQAHVRVDRRRVAYDREHRKIGHAVCISIRIAQAQALALGESSNPRGLGRGGDHRRKQASCRHAV